MGSRTDGQDEPIHDVETALERYTPHPDRRFVATDSSAEFVGDGSRWHIVDHAYARDTSICQSQPAPSVRLGPRGFPVINQEYRGRLTSYEAGYTKPVFHWSFDGGTQSVYEARDRFAELGITPTLAISPGLLGTEDRIGWETLRELAIEDGWGVSNHGHQHRRFDEMGPGAQEREVVDAIDAFRRHGVSHDHYMYSWGMAGGQVGRSIVANVYPYAWGTGSPEEATGIRDVTSPYRLPRVFVERSEPEAIEAAIDRAIEAQTGMVFLGHNVRQDEPVDEDGFETPMELIERVTAYVHDQGGEWVDSVDEVLRYSHTPIRLGGGREPVRIDALTTDAAAVDSLTRGTVGTVVYPSEDQHIPAHEATILRLDSVAYDDFEATETDGRGLRLPRQGTYNIEATVAVTSRDGAGRATLTLLADGEPLAEVTEPIHDGHATTVSLTAHPRVSEGTTLQIEAASPADEPITIRGGRERTRLSIARLG